ncbi:MAG: hypothetical protein ACLQE9_16815 [Roseiarcus sp.]
MKRASPAHGAAVAAFDNRRLECLENHWMTPPWRDSAQTREEFLFVFSDQKFGFPNFSKTFFGRIGENQKLAVEKIWIRRFSVRRPRSRRWLS